jgi:hypothetical protein
MLLGIQRLKLKRKHTHLQQQWTVNNTVLTHTQGKKKGHKMFHCHGQLSWRDKTQENYPDEI